MKTQHSPTGLLLAEHPITTFIRILAWLLLGFVFLRTAWVCDDAYITFRSIENAVTGHGLGFNAGERVQAYTHPLWMLLHLPFQAIFHNPYWSTLVISFLLTGLGLMLVARSWPSPMAWVLVPLLAISSKSLIEYSSSGLENPLTHALLAAFVVQLWKSQGRPAQLFLLSLTACGLILNRMDALLLVAPALAWAWWQTRSFKRLLILMLGMLPFLAWEGFALLYYGFPFPNTAYAKLGTGIAQSRLWEMGYCYFLDSLHRDYVTLPLIVAGLLAGCTRKHWPLAVGILCYVIYILRIGGDFMSGRFLSAPLIMSLMLIGNRLRNLERWQLGLAAAATLAGLLGPTPMLLSGADYHVEFTDILSPSGVADERACYYAGTGFLHAFDGREMPDFMWVKTGLDYKAHGTKVETLVTIGMIGYYAGPGLHIIDKVGLAEPLLARMPAMYQPEARAGHYLRAIPRGYFPSVSQDINLTTDPAVHDWVEKLRLITRGPLFSSERLSLIFRMNLGISEQQPLDQYRLPISQDIQLPLPDTTKVEMYFNMGARFHLPAGEKPDSIQFEYTEGDYLNVAWLSTAKPLGGTRLVTRGKHTLAIPSSTESIALYPENEWPPTFVTRVQLK